MRTISEFFLKTGTIHFCPKHWSVAVTKSWIFESIFGWSKTKLLEGLYFWLLHTKFTWFVMQFVKFQRIDRSLLFTFLWFIWTLFPDGKPHLRSQRTSFHGKWFPTYYSLEPLPVPIQYFLLLSSEYGDLEVDDFARTKLHHHVLFRSWVLNFEFASWPNFQPNRNFLTFDEPLSYTGSILGINLIYKHSSRFAF